MAGECDLLTRLMDVFEENESKSPRDGHVGHAVLCLARLARALLPPPDAPPAPAAPAAAALPRFVAFLDDKLRAVLLQRDTPLVSLASPRLLAARAPTECVSLSLTLCLSVPRAATTRRRSYTR